MNQFTLKFEEPAPHQDPLLAKIQINGEYLAESDYYLDIDSFFAALAGEANGINLVGGCGHPPCCGQIVLTEATVEWWILRYGTKKIHVPWLQATNAAEQIILHIMADRKLLDIFAITLERYQQQLNAAKANMIL